MSALTTLVRPRQPLPRRKARGLTLIELMVAMALLGVVGVLTWRATSQLVDARARIGGELERWQAVVRQLFCSVSAMCGRSSRLVRAARRV